MKRVRHAPELLADIERLVDFKLQTQRYKQLAYKHGVSEQTICRLVWKSTQARADVRIKVVKNAK